MMDDSMKQAEWDQRCDASPRCRLCNRPTLRAGDHHYEYGDTVICENCAPAFRDALDDAVINIMAAMHRKAVRNTEAA